MHKETQLPERPSTEELAAHFKVKPASIRSALCRKGDYYGWRPVRLPNRRLVWEAAQ